MRWTPNISEGKRETFSKLANLWIDPQKCFSQLEFIHIQSIKSQTYQIMNWNVWTSFSVKAGWCTVMRPMRDWYLVMVNLLDTALTNAFSSWKLAQETSFDASTTKARSNVTVQLLIGAGYDKKASKSKY